MCIKCSHVHQAVGLEKPGQLSRFCFKTRYITNKMLYYQCSLLDRIQKLYILLLFFSFSTPQCLNTYWQENIYASTDWVDC